MLVKTVANRAGWGRVVVRLLDEAFFVYSRKRNAPGLVVFGLSFSLNFSVFGFGFEEKNRTRM